MKINGKVFCLFEQSGTFKAEFQKLGYVAEDYDIQNEFGQTDKICDLFAEIERAYNGETSLFDSISEEDLILAFFPCTYFSENNQLATTYRHANYLQMPPREATEKILERTRHRQSYYETLCKLYSVCLERGQRLIIENPWTGATFLKYFFVAKPSFVDWNRAKRGDYFEKPTAFWFVNCEPSHGYTVQENRHPEKISNKNLCKGRSIISPDYARNFICDNIIGKAQRFTQLDLFTQ